MFHVFALIIVLASGQPAAIWESENTFQSKLECEAAAPELVATLQSKLRVEFAVAGAACATEDELRKTKQPDGGKDAERVD